MTGVIQFPRNPVTGQLEPMCRKQFRVVVLVRVAGFLKVFQALVCRLMGGIGIMAGIRAGRREVILRKDLPFQAIKPEHATRFIGNVVHRFVLWSGLAT